ncbi:MAG: TIGR00266 family protein [Clostridiales bacterium]|nr:TIGR00266 family protein [Clostridiales bacterium]
MRYAIKNAPLPVLICKLEAGESMECQKGAMSWMTESMKMSTGFGNGIGGNGSGVWGALGKVARSAATKESIFRNTYTSEGGSGEIAFASTFPGEILCFDVSKQTIVAQKSAYLANTAGVKMDIFFQKNLGAGFFGGEGFIMQRFSGNGLVFLEIDGCTCEYTLDRGESLYVDTGYIALMEETCYMDVEIVSGLGNIVAGGEGLFNTRVTGPGKVWMQTMPKNALGSSLASYVSGKR